MSVYWVVPTRFESLAGGIVRFCYNGGSRPARGVGLEGSPPPQRLPPDMMPRPLSLLLTIAALCAADIACGSPGARYVGMFADGTRVEGNVITGWHSDKAQPQLDAIRLFDPERPLRWLRNNEPDIGPVSEDAAAFVELVGGDRLPGPIGRLPAARRGMRAGRRDSGWLWSNRGWDSIPAALPPQTAGPR